MARKHVSNPMDATAEIETSSREGFLPEFQRVWGALPERVLLYAYNDPWMPQFALVDKNTNPSPLAKMILAGTA